MKKIFVVGLVGESVFMNCDHFHQDGETISVENIYDEIGGKGFNQALTIHKLGGDVTFLSAIGNDIYKQKIINDTTNLGLKHIYVEKSDRCAYATILTNKLGDNRVSVYQGCKLEDSDLPLIFSQIDESDIVLLQLEIPLILVKEIIKYAKSKNKQIILNPAPCNKWIEEFKLCDLIIPNEIEANILFGNNYMEKIKELNLNVIVTLGSKGCIHINNHQEKSYESIKTNVIDTTGAGDVFCGSIAYYLSKNYCFDDAIINANINASKSIKYHYVIPGIIGL